MTISRRSAIKQLVVISAGAYLLTSCEKKSSLSAGFKNIKLDEDQEKLIAAITDTIIPMKKADGSPDPDLPLFVNKMIDDSLTKADQDRFLKGIGEFRAYVKEKSGSSFIELDNEKRIALLQEIGDKKEDSDLKSFYQMVKGFTVRGYTSSEAYMTTVRNYKIIPGKFKGCVPVTPKA